VWRSAMLPIIHQLSGSTLIIAGLVLLPLPIPFGLLMITLGCALLAPYVPAVQRLIRGMRRKWPSLNALLLRHRKRFPPVIKRTIDKTHPVTPAE
ncbi:MAG: PGPGW domain-containing protein, partial [Pseudomonadota bacterium]